MHCTRISYDTSCLRSSWSSTRDSSRGQDRPQVILHLISDQQVTGWKIYHLILIFIFIFFPLNIGRGKLPRLRGNHHLFRVATICTRPAIRSILCIQTIPPPFLLRTEPKPPLSQLHQKMAATASALRVVAPVARIAARKTSVARTASVVKVRAPFSIFFIRHQPSPKNTGWHIAHTQLFSWRERHGGRDPSGGRKKKKVA